MARTKVYGDRVRRTLYFNIGVLEGLEAEADRRAVSANLLDHHAVTEWLEKQRAYRNVTTTPDEWEPAAPFQGARTNGDAPKQGAK